jgi:alpha-L-fucosidase 2
MKSFVLLLFLSLSVSIAIGGGFEKPKKGFVSWKPAPNWEDALLSGNGTIGTLTMGEPHDETIIVNHALGYLPVRLPNEPINQASRLAEIRDLIAQGKYEEAAIIPVNQSMDEGYGEKHWIDPFVPVCNIRMVMQPGNVSDYIRMVDFETGEAKVQWMQDGELFQRSLFVSRADSVIVMRISSSGKINMQISLRQHPIAWDQWSFVSPTIKDTKTDADGAFLTYTTEFTHKYGGVPEGFEGVALVKNIGGSLVSDNGLIKVMDADEVLFVMALEASFDSSQPLAQSIKKSLINKASNYEALLALQQTSHGELFNRVKLTLQNGSESDLQSEAFVVRARSGSTPAIIQKQFDAARYNIISSAGTNPPNLQGIWSGTWTPPWSSGFTHDGNVEVAVSHLLSSNTPELMDAYLSYHERMLPWYRKNAKNLFGTRGVHVPAHSSSHGYNIHFDETWTLSLWSGGAGWTSSILYDYYLYTGDKLLLKNRVYPFMKESAWFYEDFLFLGDDGKYVFSPSYSPENNPGNSSSQIAVNATMDVMIAKELLKNCIEAAKIVGESRAQIKKWEEMLKLMPDYRINADGELAEWLPKKYDENHSHRHVSQLYSLYERVDDEFRNSELRNAALKAVEARMVHRRREAGGEMVFGLAQLGMVAANLQQSELAGEIIDFMSRYYWAPSLATYHNSGNLFNMDMSGGFAAVVLRALAYSDSGKIVLLPALPAQWQTGTIEGMALRGQIIIEKMIWDKGGLSVEFVSSINQNVTLSAPSISSVKSNQQGSVKPLANSNNSVQLKLMSGVKNVVDIKF